ncbi:hypothetical protein TNCV_2612601 [Trichonephila clavipes]|nr:hypothetical protein TNCV_2612601 [Trichonephila clavipes]
MSSAKSNNCIDSLTIFPLPVGCGGLVVKVTDSWLVCHDFELSTAEDPLCRGAIHIEHVETQTFSGLCGVEVRSEGCLAQVSSSSLDHGLKLGGPPLIGIV